MVALYSILSVLAISLISLVGIVGLSISTKNLKSLIIYLVSFAAGALMADVFIHLLPELAEEQGFTIQSSLYILLGIVISFAMEKVIAWRHCHMPIEHNHVHRFAYMNLIGDAMHNFIDGLIIASSYAVSIPVGIASTIAIVLHEIPQEIGDFGVLIHGGFTRGKALFYNFVTALTSLVGAIVGVTLTAQSEAMTAALIPFAAGTFIYVAGSDLIPELHKESSLKVGILQTIAFIMGIGVMSLLLLLE